ncbi:MAG: hypothetical protein EA374_06465 [Acholeplasmatales bacterium]|nr:MAG: hypothetical protein EA374_06465 [Acholeplasmatales bacterium]
MVEKHPLLALHGFSAMMGVVIFVLHRLFVRDLPETGVFAWRVAMALLFLSVYCGVWGYYLYRRYIVTPSLAVRVMPLVGLLICVAILTSHVARPTRFYVTDTYEQAACAFHQDMRLNMAAFAQPHGYGMLALVTFDTQLESYYYNPFTTRNLLKADRHTLALTILETPLYPTPAYIQAVRVTQESKHAPYLCQTLRSDEAIRFGEVYLVIILWRFEAEERPPSYYEIMRLAIIEGYDLSRSFEAQPIDVQETIATLLTPYDD